MSSPDAVRQMIAKALEQAGRIDVLVNNAGMGITGPIEDTPTNEIRAVFNTNLFGAIDVMKAVLPQMRKQKYGMVTACVGGGQGIALLIENPDAAHWSARI